MEAINELSSKLIKHWQKEATARADVRPQLGGIQWCFIGSTVAIINITRLFLRQSPTKGETTQ